MKITLKASLFVCLIFLTIGEVKAQSPELESAGDVLLFAMPASALGGTLLAKDYRGTLEFTKGFLLNQGVTLIIKEVSNKPRPFNNGENAFPSGHTSTTFQSAAFIQKRYGWKYGVPAYFLASFTAYSRIKSQRHDGWDVLAGAVLGVSSAYIFTTPYQREHMSLSFTKAGNYYALGFKFEF